MHQLSSILLVDDDETTNFLNQALIERAGIAQRVLVAKNGRDALLVLDNTCLAGSASYPALILLDMNMPVMNGLEFLEAFLQRSPAPSPAPIIVIFTTTVLPRDLGRVGQLPIADVLDKPLTRAKLNSLVEHHFPQLVLPAA